MSNNSIRQFSVQTFTDFVQSSTGNFNGAFPEGATTVTPGRITFAAGTNQGLISLDEMGITYPVRVLRVILLMAGQTTWTLNFIDGSTSVNIASGTTEAAYLDEAVAFLTPGQKIQLITTGAGTTSVKMIVSLVDVNQYSSSPKGV